MANYIRVVRDSGDISISLHIRVRIEDMFDDTIRTLMILYIYMIDLHLRRSKIWRSKRENICGWVFEQIQNLWEFTIRDAGSLQNAARYWWSLSNKEDYFFIKWLQFLCTMRKDQHRKLQNERKWSFSNWIETKIKSCRQK